MSYLTSHRIPHISSNRIEMMMAATDGSPPGDSARALHHAQDNRLRLASLGSTSGAGAGGDEYRLSTHTIKLPGEPPVLRTTSIESIKKTVSNGLFGMGLGFNRYESPKFTCAPTYTRAHVAHAHLHIHSPAGRNHLRMLARAHRPIRTRA